MSNDNIVQLSSDKVKFSNINDALAAIKAGGFVVVCDDEARENEGDLVCAAATITPAMVNFMVREARGLVCVAVTPERAQELRLHPMVEDNTDPHQTAFTVSVDAGPEFGVTTGISAADRATTIQRLASNNASWQDFRRPGHIFPLQARQGGVLRRVGHTEAAIDLARLAELPALGVICEVMNDDGSMARRDELAAFAKKHNLPFITTAQIIQHRLQSERFVVRKAAAELDTRFGVFNVIGYQDQLNGVEHLALVKGSLETLTAEPPLVCVHHENVLSDVLGGRDDSLRDLDAAMDRINDAGRGAVLYLRSGSENAQGVVGALKAQARRQQNSDMQQHAMPDARSDWRDYGVGAQILTDLGIKQFRLITSGARKIVALRGYGLEVVDTILLPNNDDAAARPWTQPVVPPVLQATREEPVAAKAAPVVAKPEEKPAEKPIAKEPAKEQPKVMTMKMGGQIINNQALFEG